MDVTTEILAEAEKTCVGQSGDPTPLPHTR